MVCSRVSFGFDGKLKCGRAALLTAKVTNTKLRPSLADASYTQRLLLSRSISTDSSTSSTEVRESLFLPDHDGLHTGLVKALQDLRQLSHLVAGIGSKAEPATDSAIPSDKIFFVEHELLMLSTADEQLGSPLEDFITRACSMAGHIYIYVAVRHLLLNAPLFDTFVSQLHDALDHPYNLSIWSHSRTVTVLWVLTVGGCAAMERPQRSWFIGHLLGIMSSLKVTTLGRLRQLLEQAVWLDGPFNSSLTTLWSEVEHQREILVAR